MRVVYSADNRPGAAYQLKGFADAFLQSSDNQLYVAAYPQSGRFLLTFRWNLYGAIQYYEILRLDILDLNPDLVIVDSSARKKALYEILRWSKRFNSSVEEKSGQHYNAALMQINSVLIDGSSQYCADALQYGKSFCIAPDANDPEAVLNAIVAEQL